MDKPTDTSTLPEPGDAKPAPTTSEAKPAAGPDLSGKVLGDFRLLRRLGTGGMGHVFLAEQISLKRKVALKIMRPDLAANPVSLQRFKAEAEAVARATHANIVQVYAIGEAEGVHYMALEYVEGFTLRDYLAKKGPPEVPLALSILRQVAAALQRASELGIIHRDVKPENILLTKKGEVKVADFGLSRCFAPEQQPLNLTQSGVTMGTPLYMSPEQVEGKPLDPRTDIYSLGATCYHLLAGQAPFRGQTAFEVAIKHVKEEPTPLAEIRPDLPPELCTLIHRMMAKCPDQRYPTCRDLIKDIARVREALAGQKTQGVELVPGSAPGASGEPIPVPRRRRPYLGTGLTAATVVLAAVVGGVLAWPRSQPVAYQTPPQPAPVGPDAEVAAIFSASEREHFLKKAWQEYANPERDPTRKALGLAHALELGMIYLEQWRLGEADRLFVELIHNQHKVKEYTTLGKVGKAMVLAFNNKPAESNKLFLDLAGNTIPEKERFEKNRALFTHPQLRHMVAKALDYNKANEKQDPFPPALEYLRRPPTPMIPGPRRPGADKPVGKKP